MSDTSWIRVDVMMLIATPFLTVAPVWLAVKVTGMLAGWLRPVAGVRPPKAHHLSGA